MTADERMRETMAASQALSRFTYPDQSISQSIRLSGGRVDHKQTLSSLPTHSMTAVTAKIPMAPLFYLPAIISYLLSFQGCLSLSFVFLVLVGLRWVLFSFESFQECHVHDTIIMCQERTATHVPRRPYSNASITKT